MNAASRFSYLKGMLVGGLIVLGAAGLPGAAEAQARGTLQATATVVDTRQGFGALDAARSAVRAATDSRLDSRIGSLDTVATVAQVSVERTADRHSALVVTIDYSRN
jgi:hypothetical protein